MQSSFFIIQNDDYIGVFVLRKCENYLTVVNGHIQFNSLYT